MPSSLHKRTSRGCREKEVLHLLKEMRFYYTKIYSLHMYNFISTREKNNTLMAALDGESRPEAVSTKKFSPSGLKSRLKHSL
jgi:hypothetical protein